MKIKLETTETTCCENQRIMVDESFSYECEFENGKLNIYTSDYCTDGFDNYRCINCGKVFEPTDIETIW